MFGKLKQRFSDLEQAIQEQAEQLRHLEAARAGFDDRISGLNSAPPQPYDDAELRELVAELAGMMEGVLEGQTKLTLAVAEGIDRVSRSERRVNATVARARKELAEVGLESPGLEAEAAELRLLDGGASDGSELPPVQHHVEETQSPPRGIPGTFSQEVLQALRG